MALLIGHNCEIISGWPHGVAEISKITVADVFRHMIKLEQLGTNWNDTEKVGLALCKDDPQIREAFHSILFFTPPEGKKPKGQATTTKLQ